jgi:hypothetical protein
MPFTLLVRKENLDALPEPVRRYFDDWGRKGKVLGVEVVRVDTKLHLDRYGYDRRGKAPGVGPGHSVDCHSYNVGDVDFNEWVRKHPNLVEQLFVHGDEGGGCCDDDD